MGDFSIVFNSSSNVLISLVLAERVLLCVGRPSQATSSTNTYRFIQSIENIDITVKQRWDILQWPILCIDILISEPWKNKHRSKRDIVKYWRLHFTRSSAGSLSYWYGNTINVLSWRKALFKVCMLVFVYATRDRTDLNLIPSETVMLLILLLSLYAVSFQSRYDLILFCFNVLF